MKLSNLWAKKSDPVRDAGSESVRPPTQTTLINSNDPIAPIMQSAMRYAELLGIDKKDIGKMILKAAVTGKFDIKDNTDKRKSPFQKTMETIYDGWFFYVILLSIWIVYRYVTHVWMP